MNLKRPLIIFFVLLISCAHSFSLYLLPNIWTDNNTHSVSAKIPGILTKVAKRRREVIITSISTSTAGTEEPSHYVIQESQSRKLVFIFTFLRKLFTFHSVAKAGILNAINNSFSSVQIRYLISPPELSTQYHKLLI